MLTALRTARAPRIVAPYTRLRPLSAQRAYASVTDLESLPKPGERLHGFTLKRRKHVPELELSALHFVHDKTGADYLHVARDDTNNVFSIGFKTNPPDATGVPHILEHVTLCGSEKYPVRDPFFKMLPRSLNNHMNAFTSTDYTMYPIATTNAKDFKNLMGMYLDSVLHPRLTKMDFIQEGWRVGPENPKTAADESGKDLVFKGVVYNEMKGQFSDATYLYFARWFQELFPSLNFYGGDPQKITDLTWEHLRKFHQQHYHPSNSKILTYGDQPFEEHMQLLGPELDRFEKINVDRDFKVPKSLSKPKEVTVQGPFDPLTPPDKQYKTSVTWLLGDTRDVHEDFALQIATTLLLTGYGSPMYRALIESGLGTDFTPNTGYENSSAKGIFSIGLNGVSKENLPKVKKVIADTLQDTLINGFEKDKISGLLHQLELGLKHKSAKFGMGIMRRSLPGWFNGQDPWDGLEWNSIVMHFKDEGRKKRYLEKLLDKYLLNDKTLTFVMEPSEDYANELAADEAKRLETKIAEAVRKFGGEKEARAKLREQELKLLEEQESGRSQSLDCLPTLRVSDIPRQQKPIELRDSTIVNNTMVQWREAPTNEITYFRSLSLFKNLPDELRMLVPLFCDSLMRIGTKDKSMEQLEDLIKLKTGGITFGYHTTTSPYDVQKAEEGLTLSGYALDKNMPAMYELIQTLLLETDFDSPKAHQMIKQLLTTEATGAVDAIASGGHMYAMRYSNAGLSPSGKMSEQTGGLAQVKLIADLASAEDNEEAMTGLIQKLKAIQALVVVNLYDNARVALTCGADSATSNEEALQKFLSSTTNANLSSPSPQLSSEAQHYPASGKTFFNFPYQVSYSGLALPTAPYTEPSSAPFAILGKLLTHKHLHHEIREKGGAYGAGAYSSGLGGVFGMYSYRDPNPENTMRIMYDAGRWAAERQWSDQELEEAKLSVFQSVDAPQSVASEGMTRFISGVDQAMEQNRREWLLDVSKEQVKQAAEKLVRDLPKASVALLGAQKEFVKESEGWEVKDMGMAAASAPDAAAAATA